MESLRTGLIATGLIGFLATYFILLRRAFKRDTLWGLLSLFGFPFGGWAHALTDRFLNSRMLMINLGALGFAAVSAFWFPRPPVTGYWIDEYGQLFLRLDADGKVRNYDLAPDGRFVFRGFKIGTAQLSIASKTRLKFEGVPDVDYGYLNPRTGVIELYNKMNDRELGLAADSGGAASYRLSRVPEPLNATMSATVARLEQREAVQSAVTRYFSAADPATPPPLGPSVLGRYTQHVEAARTLAPADLVKQPFPRIVEILRLRATHGPALRSAVTAEELFQRDLQSDAFRIRSLKTYEITDIALYPGNLQALVQFRRFVDRGEYAYDQITLEKTPAGVWGFDVDWHLPVNTPSSHPEAPPPSLDDALNYLAETQGISVSPQLLAPAR
jgi:hypothetical protein